MLYPWGILSTSQCSQERFHDCPWSLHLPMRFLRWRFLQVCFWFRHGLVLVHEAFAIWAWSPSLQYQQKHIPSKVNAIFCLSLLITLNFPFPSCLKANCTSDDPCFLILSSTAQLVICFLLKSILLSRSRCLRILQMIPILFASAKWNCWDSWHPSSQTNQTYLEKADQNKISVYSAHIWVSSRHFPSSSAWVITAGAT